MRDMAGTVTVKALTDFPFKSKHVRSGDTLTVSTVEAIVLSRKRYVTRSLQGDAPQPEPPSVEEPVETPRRSRRYRRRDMVAEGITSDTE